MKDLLRKLDFLMVSVTFVIYALPKAATGKRFGGCASSTIVQTIASISATAS